MLKRHALILRYNVPADRHRLAIERDRAVAHGDVQMAGGVSVAASFGVGTISSIGCATSLIPRAPGWARWVYEYDAARAGAEAISPAAEQRRIASARRQLSELMRYSL